MHAQAINAPVYEQTKPRILVVDDNDEVRHFLAFCLNESGFTVVSASNGYAAKDRLDRECFDLVVAVICMPGITGNVFLEYVRMIYKHIPVIAVTASPELAHSDFDLVVTKPLEIKAFVASIQNLLVKYPGITHQLNSVKMKHLKQLQGIEYDHQKH